MSKYAEALEGQVASGSWRDYATKNAVTILSDWLIHAPAAAEYRQSRLSSMGSLALKSAKRTDRNQRR
jgi:hypothetical protein